MDFCVVTVLPEREGKERQEGRECSNRIGKRRVLGKRRKKRTL